MAIKLSDLQADDHEALGANALALAAMVNAPLGESVLAKMALTPLGENTLAQMALTPLGESALAAMARQVSCLPEPARAIPNFTSLTDMNWSGTLTPDTLVKISPFALPEVDLEQYRQAFKASLALPDQITQAYMTSLLPDIDREEYRQAFLNLVDVRPSEALREALSSAWRGVPDIQAAFERSARGVLAGFEASNQVVKSFHHLAALPALSVAEMLGERQAPAVIAKPEPASLLRRVDHLIKAKNLSDDEVRVLENLSERELNLILKLTGQAPRARRSRQPGQSELKRVWDTYESLKATKTADEIARRLNMSKATLYRRLDLYEQKNETS